MEQSLREAFLQAKDRREIEDLGRTLSIAQFFELLDVCGTMAEGMRHKLNPLLVGISHQLFYYSLLTLSPAQIQLLCRVADDEPLQYHTTLLIHELSNQAEVCADNIELLKQKILNYDVALATQADIDAFRQGIQQATDFFRSAFGRIEIALTFAWNSNREELIDKLTTLKENWLRYVSAQLGVPAQNSSHPATGVYRLLDDHFGAVYSGAPEGHPLATLKDDDSAFDALTALSVWYVEDYWEIGLLPGIEKVEELQLNPRQYDQNSRRQHREHLSAIAKDNLATLGLRTVADLKQKQLYSRRMLVRYIQDNQQQLKSFSRP